MKFVQKKQIEFAKNLFKQSKLDVASFKEKREYVVPFGIASAVGIISSMVVLIFIHNSVMRLPFQHGIQGGPAQGAITRSSSLDKSAIYNPIAERNLFRAQLQIELPKPKTPKEIEEEMLTALIKQMTLKGVMLEQTGMSYAVVDRGSTNGVWIYKYGDQVEKGLKISEITQDSIILAKGDFRSKLYLFTAKPPPKASAPSSRITRAAGGAREATPRTGAAARTTSRIRGARTEGGSQEVQQEGAPPDRAAQGQEPSQGAEQRSAPRIRTR